MEKDLNEKLIKAEERLNRPVEHSNKFIRGIIDGTSKLSELSLEEMAETFKERDEAEKEYFKLYFEKEGLEESKINEWLRKSGYIV